MPTLDDLYDEFDSIVHDSAWDSDKVISIFNDGIGDIARQVLIPELESIAVVTTLTTVNKVALPTDFMRKLRDCYSQTQRRTIAVYGSVPLLYRNFDFLDSPGRVMGVAVMGLYLYYQGIPSTVETLQINYYAKPATYEGHEDPDILKGFQRDLLIAFACWKAYGVIEEGMDGVKTQTQFYWGEYMKALGKLAVFVGPEQNKPIDIGDEFHGVWI